MRALIWSVFAVLAAGWTGLVALSVKVTGWLLGLGASGQAGEMATAAGPWPVPAWLALWVDPAWVQSLQAAWIDLVQWLGQVLPSTTSLMDWIAPLMWAGWALGMLCLLLPAVGFHWLASRYRTPALQHSG
ncbi:MAG: hypothetical protein AB7S86_07735 [Hydrogenophaga sp.]|uniref:hypothetical protein n=1 Tax=Hydrogenophaga sp. TaxID=1904254 RepID=UPI003D1497B5